jgi:hypothetical protein
MRLLFTDLFRILTAPVPDPDPQHWFFALPDPDQDPLVRGMDPDPALNPDSGSFYHHAKIIRKILNPTIL